MPTSQVWRAEESFIETVWAAPLTSEEIRRCFRELVTLLESAPEPLPVLLDIRESGKIPSDTPRWALTTGFLRHKHCGPILVFGMDPRAEFLASIASVAARKQIDFYPNREAALAVAQRELVPSTTSMDRRVRADGS